MNDSIKRISLDIHKASSGETVNAKRGDTGRTIHISLVDGGVPYTISKDCYAVFTAKKPDGKTVYNNCTIENNTIIYEITEQTVAVEGKVNSEIKLYGADDKLITSAKFTILVYGTVYNEGDEIESSAEFSALTKLVGEARQATNEANEAAQKAAHTAKSLMVVGKTEGRAINLDDAIDQYLVGCRVFGKTTQEGAPTPEAPVELISSVEGDSLSLFVTGKNLFTGWIVGGVHPTTGEDYAVTTQRRTEYIPISTPGQKYSISKIPNTLFNLVAFYDANKTYLSRTAAGPSGGRLVEPPMGAKYFRLSIYENADASGKIADAEAMATVTMIEAGETVTEYQTAKPIQKATIFTPNGLHGIPVTSGGNYTDSNGQQWICDEVDFSRGVYIQRVAVKTVNQVSEQANESNTIMTVYMPIINWNTASQLGLLTSIATPNISAGAYYNTTPNVCRFNTVGTTIIFDISREDYPTLADFNAYIAENPVKVAYILATPTETPLTEEDLAAYATLHTYRNHTVVSNDGHAYMELEYVMDAKKYIDSISGGGSASARLTEVKVIASAWKTEADGLHSQVVTIAGVTPYSKVDLLPSVEQLAIFHNKDVAFVTENEDGVVTVFAIGDKPLLDYTMQAQITEVVV